MNAHVMNSCKKDSPRSSGDNEIRNMPIYNLKWNVRIVRKICQTP